MSGIAIVLAALFLTVCAQPAQAQSLDTLSFFQNWFLPGDVVAVGVGLRSSGINGTATGMFTMTVVPCITAAGTVIAADPLKYPNSVGFCPPGSVPADVVAAFLYWEAEETTSAPSGMNGTFDGQAIVGKLLGNPSNRSCFSSGGTGGNGNASGRVYRADVRNKLLVNNKPVANGTHTITLPESGGTGNGQVTFTNGATFVAVYRIFVPGNPNPTVSGNPVPFRSVVAYDGAYTLDKFAAPMTQTVGGFYQASTLAALPPAAKMIPIVSNGQPGFVETLTVNGAQIGGSSPFQGSTGARWDNPTFTNIPVGPAAASYSTQVTSGNNQTCLTFAGLWTSVNVDDPDGDGLVSIWETSGMHLNRHLNLNLLSSTTHRWDPRDPTQPATFGSCTDYPNEPDFCVNLPLMGGLHPPAINKKDIFVEVDSLVAPDHKHYVKYDAINAVGTALRAQNIELHVDVGKNAHYFDAAGNPKDFIVPSAFAQGGEEIDETQSPLLCAGNGCAFPGISVLSWKKGFDFVKNGLIVKQQNGTLAYQIPTHFKSIREDVVRYGIFAHAFAAFKLVAGEPKPDVDASGNLLTYSGVGDRPGSEFMVTLGLWRFDNPTDHICDPYVDCVDRTGTWQVQAGTFMHELGHLIGLSHAGKDPLPNFKPNYQSVMNYHYQTRLLTGPDNKGHVNYSNGGLNQFNEQMLSEAPGALGPALLPYRVRFWGPTISPNEPASKHCANSPLGSLGVRVEAENVSTPDWNRNGTQDPGFTSFDVNCDGDATGIFTDFNDWGALNFPQLSASFNLGGTSAQVGGFDAGGFDAGGFDAGGFDAGGFDAGGFDAGGFDAGGFDAGELDQTTNVSGGGGATSADGPLTATNKLDRITLNWGSPGGIIRRFNIYRKGPSDTDIVLINHIDYANGAISTTFDDVVNDFSDSGTACPTTKTCYNTAYDYYITSVDFTLVVAAGGTVDLSNWPAQPNGNNVNPSASPSGFSNRATSKVTHLFVIAQSQNAVYGDNLPASLLFTPYGEVLATLDTSKVICSIPAALKYNIGTYTITCSGPATTSLATDGVSYNVTYNENGTPHSAGVLTITARPITVTAAASTKPYDGTTSSTAIPTITSGNLVNGDTAAFTETYDNPNAGINHVMTPAGKVNDGNNGSNYNVRPVTISTGVITKANTTTTITSDAPDPSIVGQSFTVNVTVATAVAGASSPPAASPTGTATVRDASGASCQITLASGSGSCSLTLTILGPRTLTATYSGDTNYNGSNGNAPHQVNYNVTISALKTPVKTGSAIPVNFRATNFQGAVYTETSRVLKIQTSFNGTVPPGGCQVSVSPNIANIQTAYQSPNFATGSSSLQLVTNGFQFNLDSSFWLMANGGHGPGCYTILVTMDDQAVPALANGRVSSAVEVRP